MNQRRRSQAMRRSRDQPNRRLSNVLLLAALLVASGAIVSMVWRSAAPDILAKFEPIRPAVIATEPDPGDPPNIFGGSQPIMSAKPGDPPGYTRVPAPKIEPGPRRIGIQIGHWQTQNVPPELSRLEVQTGTSWDGIDEVDVSLDVGTRLASLLKSHGYLVDLIPTTVPVGYLADVFIALHLDGDGVGEAEGYKLAHGSRRGVYEQQLLDDISGEYGAATGFAIDPNTTSSMRGYYAFNWQRFRSATSPFTPSVILEMGFLSNDHDREFIMNDPDTVAGGIANGIERFLAEVPSQELFSKDLLLPPTRRPSPSPTASP